jgi:hypothetical protein
MLYFNNSFAAFWGDGTAWLDANCRDERWSACAGVESESTVVGFDFKRTGHVGTRPPKAKGRSLTPRPCKNPKVGGTTRLALLSAHDLRTNAFRVCREGKPVPTFPDHALVVRF